jgi:hypothetical protein
MIPGERLRYDDAMVGVHGRAIALCLVPFLGGCDALLGWEDRSLGEADGSAADATAGDDGTTADGGHGTGDAAVGDGGGAADAIALPDALPVFDGSTCATTCLPSAPTGWSGPFAFYVGPAAQTPACPVAWPTTVSALGAGTLTAPPAQCNCSCGPVVQDNGYGCFWGAWNCQTCNGAGTGSGYDTLSDVCVQVPYPQASGCGFVHWGGSQYGAILSGAHCNPSLARTVPLTSFSQAALLCGGGAFAGVCDGGVCALPVPAPFQTGYCIAKVSPVGSADGGAEGGAPADAAVSDAGVSCPASYPVEYTGYAGVADTRDCSGCSCNINAVTCTGSATLYSDTNCQTAIGQITSGSTACPNLQPGSMKPAWSVSGGCPASGGQPKGSATPSGVVTICCAP